jgi:lysine-specific demethylase/histidyl-hydroxylase NO66
MFKTVRAAEMTSNIDILGGVDFQIFAQEWLEKKHLLIKHALSGTQVCHLMPRHVLDDLLNRIPLDPRVYQVIKGGSVDGSPKMHPQGGLDPLYIVDEYRQGATLRFTNVERLLPSVEALCKFTASRFKCPIFANVYATPASATGFNPHFDDHDVFIIQCYGQKMWSIYDGYADEMALPLSGFRFEPETHLPGNAESTFALSPGDVLYIPRGRMHSASTINDGWNGDSIHITIGVQWVTVNEIFMDILSKQILSDVEFRQAIAGFGSAHDSSPPIDLDGGVGKILDLAAQVFSRDTVEKSISDLLSRWRDIYHPIEHVQLFRENCPTSLDLES